MPRALVAFALSVCSFAAQAQTGMLILLKHKPVWEFVKATEAATFACELPALAYWDSLHLASLGGEGNASDSLSEVRSCVSKQREAPREKLVTAVKYLEGKPGSAKALKEFYSKWTASMESLAPEYRETRTANESRKSRADQALKESKRALELELDLGT